jgi:ATP-binding cassette subfamily C protein
MAQTPQQKGAAELAYLRAQSRLYFWIVALFSLVVNMLMLTGPLYMLHVYDDVLGSRSIETLVALTLIVAFLYAMMGILDYTRGRIMARVGARFQAKLDRRVFDAVVRKSAVAPDENTATGLRDLEAIQRLITSPVLMAFFDLPWTPVFLAGIALFHPWLGLLALAGGSLLIFITYLNQMLTRNLLTQSNIATYTAETMSDQIRNEAELIRSLGMSGATFSRWHVARAEALKPMAISAAWPQRLGIFIAVTWRRSARFSTHASAKATCASGNPKLDRYSTWRATSFPEGS